MYHVKQVVIFQAQVGNITYLFFELKLDNVPLHRYHCTRVWRWDSMGWSGDRTVSPHITYPGYAGKLHGQL